MKTLVPGKQTWIFPLFALQLLNYQPTNQETAGHLSAVNVLIQQSTVEIHFRF